MVEGRVVVDDHKLTTLEMSPLLARHRRIAARITGKRTALVRTSIVHCGAKNSAAP